MNYSEFIEEASKFTNEMPDKSIHVKGYLNGEMEIICGYVSPDMVPVTELGIPTEYIISHTYVTVEDFEAYFKVGLSWMEKAEIKERIENMISEVKARIHELVGE